MYAMMDCEEAVNRWIFRRSAKSLSCAHTNTSGNVVLSTVIKMSTFVMSKTQCECMVSLETSRTLSERIVNKTLTTESGAHPVWP